MSDRKKESQMDKKKKAFIQEQIVPERNNRIKRGVLFTVAVMFFAVLFGVTASFTMSIVGPYFEELQDKKKGSKVSLEQEIDEQGAVLEGKEEGSGVTSDISAETVVQEPVVIEKELTLEDLEESYNLVQKTAKQYNGCIVTVSVLMQGVDWFDNPSEMKEAAFGAILAEDAERLYIVTRYESIQEVERIQVTFTDNTTTEAKLRGKDKVTNLAVLAVAKRQLAPDTLEKIMVASLGDSYSLVEGTFIMALGSPNGYLYSIDTGIISGQKRELSILDGKLELFPTTMGYYTNGEGIVVDLEGRILGMISYDYDSDNSSEVNTMVGISRLKLILEKMINKQPLVEFGVISNDIPEENQENLGVENGIYITEVKRNSPALEAGIRTGDVIVEIDGTRVSSVINFSNILAKYEPGAELLVKYVRTSSVDKNEREAHVVLGER